MVKTWLDVWVRIGWSLLVVMMSYVWLTTVFIGLISFGYTWKFTSSLGRHIESIVDEKIFKNKERVGEIK